MKPVRVGARTFPSIKAALEAHGTPRRRFEERVRLGWSVADAVALPAGARRSPLNPARLRVKALAAEVAILRARLDALAEWVGAGCTGACPISRPSPNQAP